MAAAAAIMSPSRFGKSAGPPLTGWGELADQDSQATPSDSTAVGDGYEWGLGTDTKLFEVSAKEGDGMYTTLPTYD
jgi:hypothetical protein